MIDTMDKMKSPFLEVTYINEDIDLDKLDAQGFDRCIPSDFYRFTHHLRCEGICKFNNAWVSIFQKFYCVIGEEAR